MSLQIVSQKVSLELNCKHIRCFTDAAYAHSLTLPTPLHAEGFNAFSEGFLSINHPCFRT